MNITAEKTLEIRKEIIFINSLYNNNNGNRACEDKSLELIKKFLLIFDLKKGDDDFPYIIEYDKIFWLDSFELLPKRLLLNIIKKLVKQYNNLYENNISKIYKLREKVEYLKKEQRSLLFRVEGKEDWVKQLQLENSEIKNKLEELLADPLSLLYEKSSIKIKGYLENEFYKRFGGSYKNWEYRNRFYGCKEWGIRRYELLKFYHWKCQFKFDGCTEIANDIHHITSSWNIAICLDPWNLLPICLDCHNIFNKMIKKRNNK